MNLKFQVVLDYFGQAKEEMIDSGAGAGRRGIATNAMCHQLPEGVECHDDQDSDQRKRH